MAKLRPWGTKLIVMVINAEQAKLLRDVIDMHVEGVITAKGLTTEDPTIDSAEQLLDLMSGYDDDLAMLSEVRKCLT